MSKTKKYLVGMWYKHPGYGWEWHEKVVVTSVVKDNEVKLVLKYKDFPFLKLPDYIKNTSGEAYIIEIGEKGGSSE